MNLTDTLDGLYIDATFDVTNDAGVEVKNCHVRFLLDGVKLGGLFEEARKSAVIKIQRPARPLTEAELRSTFKGEKPYTVHISHAGRKIESPAKQAAARKAALKAMSDQELTDLGFTEEMIELVRNS